MSHSDPDQAHLATAPRCPRRAPARLGMLLGAVACLIAIAAARPTPASAVDATSAGALRIEAPWVRPSLGNTGVSAAYMTILDTSLEGDRLLAVASDVAQAVELHTHIMDGEVMKMRRIDAIEVPPGASVALHPGGHHVMLFGLKRRLLEGEEVALTLTFERAGAVALVARVEKRGPIRGSHDGAARGSNDGNGAGKAQPQTN